MDQRMWRDETTGYMCCILRSPGMGHLNGYVAVPEDHPLHNVKRWAGGEGVDSDTSGFYGKLKCHGDVTFAGTLEIDEQGTWWIGFDCAHASIDLVPLAWSNLPSGRAGTVYRDFAYVQDQCTGLAYQLAYLAANHTMPSDSPDSQKD